MRRVLDVNETSMTLISSYIATAAVFHIPWYCTDVCFDLCTFAILQ